MIKNKWICGRCNVVQKNTPRVICEGCFQDLCYLCTHKMGRHCLCINCKRMPIDKRPVWLRDILQEEVSI